MVAAHRIRLRTVRSETFPIRGGFTIARGSKRDAIVVVAELTAALPDSSTASGKGECVPYARYGESVEGVIAAIEGQREAVAAGLDREALQHAMPAGAARNALDSAFWDLEAKLARTPAWRLAGLAQAPVPLPTAFTLSLAEPDVMAEAARAAAGMPLLKLKLGGPDDIACVAAVRAAAPGARLIADVNEGWTFDRLVATAPALAALGVELIEQPLPAAADSVLESYQSPVPLGADESCHGTDDLDRLARRYQAVNVKLDKTGGLTAALSMAAAARERRLGVMVGCMVATSLSMAPAFLVAQQAEYVDLDGPLLLERDRTPAIAYDGAWMQPPPDSLWG